MMKKATKLRKHEVHSAAKAATKDGIGLGACGLGLAAAEGGVPQVHLVH